MDPQIFSSLYEKISILEKKFEFWLFQNMILPMSVPDTLVLNFSKAYDLYHRDLCKSGPLRLGSNQVKCPNAPLEEIVL